MCNFLSDYNWNIWIIHFLAAIGLFCIVNWLGKHSISLGYMQISVSMEEDSSPAFNFIFRVISPIVFFIFFIVVVQNLGFKEYTKNAYMIVIFYWAFRTVIRGLWGRMALTNKVGYFTCAIICICITYWLYFTVSKVDNILPDPKSLLNEMWILVILFIYNVINRMQPSNNNALNRKEHYIKKKYLEYKKEYNSIIKKRCHNQFYEAITYAIMIYENFNRPKFVRLIERIYFHITKKPHTLGIMQVRTKNLIDDKTSIVMAIDIIKNATLKHKIKVKKDAKKYKYKYKYDNLQYAVYEIAGTYNCNNEKYQSEVRDIYDIIEKNYNNIEKHYKKI